MKKCCRKGGILQLTRLLGRARSYRYDWCPIIMVSGSYNCLRDRADPVMLEIGALVAFTGYMIVLRLRQANRLPSVT